MEARNAFAVLSKEEIDLADTALASDHPSPDAAAAAAELSYIAYLARCHPRISPISPGRLAD